MRSRPIGLLITLLLCGLLVAGCDLPWPLNRLAAGRPQPSQQELYVASWISRNVGQQEGVIVVAAPQASTFQEGEVIFFVINKWSGLNPGEYKEAAVVRTLEGRELAREEASFALEPEELTATVMEPFRFEALPAGRYLMVIELDGVERARYQFAVVGS